MLSKRVIALSLLVIGVSMIAMSQFFHLVQQKLIYHPRSYFTSGAEHLVFAQQILPNSEQLRYDGQTSVYLPPDKRAGVKVPKHIWVLFGGNAARAMDWHHLINNIRSRQYSPVQRSGFLLIEYPGYGGNPGQPCPETIENATHRAIEALAARLNMTRAEMSTACTFSVLGHSLGAATGLQWAAASTSAVGGRPRLMIDTVVLLAPFTSMYDLIERMFGVHVASLFQLHSRHNFDNRQQMKTLINNARQTTIHVFHGAQDSLIPSWMGKALVDIARYEKEQDESIKESSETTAFFIELTSTDHNLILRHDAIYNVVM